MNLYLAVWLRRFRWLFISLLALVLLLVGASAVSATSQPDTGDPEGPTLHSITYDPTVGSGAPGPQQCNGPWTVTTVEPSYGWWHLEFYGWNAAINGSGDWYMPGQEISSCDADLTLYARYNPVEVTLVYETQGGVNGPGVETCTVNTAQFISSVVPSRPGFTFVEWNFLADGSHLSRFYPGGNYICGNLGGQEAVLYAQWAAVVSPAVLTYDNSNGSSAAPGPQECVDDSWTVTSTVPTKNENDYATAYAFSGWNTALDGSGTLYSAGDSVSCSEDLTLYAKFERSSYYIRYNPNNGSAYVDFGNCVAGSAHTVPAWVSPSKAGYTFSHWMGASPGRDDVGPLVAGDVLTCDRMWYPYAVFDPFLMVLDANGGSSTWSSGTNCAPSFDFVNSYATREGYTFIGWNTVPDGSGTMYFNTYQQSPWSMTCTEPSTTVYAQWSLAAAPAPEPVPSPVPTPAPDTDAEVILPVTPETPDASVVSPEVFSAVVDGSTASVSSGGLELSVSAPLVPLSGPASRGRVPVVAGSSLDVSGSGFVPGSLVEVWLHSNPELLKTVSVEANGSFATQVELPATVSLGDHVVRAVGETLVSGATVVELPVELVASVSLPSTGSGSALAVNLAVLFAAAGLMLLLLGRRFA